MNVPRQMKLSSCSEGAHNDRTDTEPVTDSGLDRCSDERRSKALMEALKSKQANG